MKYFVAVNGQQTGPFEEDQLLAQNVTPDTLIWTEGMTEWRPAKEVLPQLFGAPVPPMPNSYYGPQNAEQRPPLQPKNYLIESILVTIFCCLPFGIVGIIKASNVNNLYNQGQYEAAEQASREAKKWTTWGFIIGCIYVIGVTIYTIGVIAYTNM